MSRHDFFFNSYPNKHNDKNLYKLIKSSNNHFKLVAPIGHNTHFTRRNTRKRAVVYRFLSLRRETNDNFSIGNTQNSALEELRISHKLDFVHWVTLFYLCVCVNVLVSTAKRL